MRADARRNYERLIDVARTAFAERGTDASLDDIACRAGVGIGTLYRHFPSRDDLVEAVVRETQVGVADEGRRLLQAGEPFGALAHWLDLLVRHAASLRGLSASLAATRCDGRSALGTSCEDMRAVGGALVARAQQAGAIRADVGADEVLDLAVAVAWVNEQGQGDADRTRQLLGLLMDGLRPQEAAVAASHHP